jgi:hypothetical protein
MPPTNDDLERRLARIEELVAGRFGPISDPAPDDFGRTSYHFGPWWGAIPKRPVDPSDPAPVDLSRFSRVQLELAVHQIAAERIRLDSLEGMVKEQLAAFEQ